MSITVVHEWTLKEGESVEESLQTIQEYADYLMQHEPALELSMWLQARDEPRRFFHISAFKDDAALKRLESSDGTQRFIDKLYPTAEGEGPAVRHVLCDVVVSSGGEMPVVSA